MAAHDVETTGDDSQFNFDLWIISNKLSEIKEYFIKHNMTTVSTLTTQSKQFSSFIADQMLLTRKSQFIPKAFNAIQTLQLQNMNNKSDIVVISEKENNMLKNMKSDLKQLSIVETQIITLKQQSFQTASRVKITNNSQIEDAKKKIKDATINAIMALQTKEKQILESLNKLSKTEAKYDNEMEHPVLKETMLCLSETKQVLCENIKKFDNYIHSSEHQDIDLRKNIMCDIYEKASAKFKDFECKSKADVSRVQHQISYDDKLCQQMMVNININHQEYAKLMNGIERIATIKINNYLPLTVSNIEVKADKKRLWNEMTQNKYTALMDWLKENGSNFANFKQTKLNGLYATREGEKLIFATIPPTCIMTTEKAKESPIGKKLMKIKDAIQSQHTWIAAYLLQERQKGMNSYWFPFIDMLPKQFNTVPIYFNEDEIKQLKASKTIKKIHSRLKVWHQEYDLLKDVFESENISFEDFVWARLVTITRIFGLRIDDNKTSGLVPFADLLDHRKPKNVKWTYDDKQSAFIMESSCKVKIGDELFVTYGTKCNSRFFCNYGFILDSKNDANEARMSLNTCILEMSKEALDIKKVQKINSLLQSSEFLQIGYDVNFMVGCRYSKVDTTSLFGMARLMSCDEKEMDSLENVESFEKINPLSISNERKALKLISESAQVALNKFDTTTSEDEELLENTGSLTTNQRNIILMRRGEKQVLNIYVNLYSQFIKNKLWWNDTLKLIENSPPSINLIFMN